MKKVIGIGVVVALVLAVSLPAAVGAWDLSDPSNLDTTVSTVTPGGLLIAKAMAIAESLLSKYVNYSFAVNATTVESWNGTNWVDVPANAFVVDGLTTMGQTLVGNLGDLIAWGVAFLADLMRLMVGA